MKKLRFKKLGLLIGFALAHCCAQAQGTVYLSNLDAPSTGSYSVASDSWLAIGFVTGSNPAGYLLNSVELAILDATGSPSSFALSVHFQSPFGGIPGFSLSPLIGSTDPQSAGTYIFPAPPNVTLLPDNRYFIVLSAENALADGAYQWSTTTTSSTIPGNGWSGGGVWVSSGFWQSLPNYTQFALNATAIPEPSALSLLAIIYLPAFFLRRRYAGKG